MKITCPHCGAEYCVSEIFYPDDLTGKVRSVIKDDTGKIMFLDEEEPELEQTFCCEWCGRFFKAKASIAIETVKDEYTFDEDEF